MNNVKEAEIKTELDNLIKNGGLETLKTANPYIYDQLSAIDTTAIIVGECAKFTKGHFEGNLRTDGHKFAGDIKYTRTLNFDFTTGDITFVSEDNRADFGTVERTAKLYGLQRYAQAEACYTKNELIGKEYFELKDKMKALKRNLRGLCVAEHRKLGFYFESLNVLEYSFIPSTITEPPLYPVFVLLKDKKDTPYKTFIGWYSETDGNAKTDFKLNELQYEPVYKKTRIVPPAEKRKKVLKGVFGTLAVLAAIGVVVYLTLFL